MKRFFLLIAMMFSAISLYATTNTIDKSELFVTGINKDFLVTSDGGIKGSTTVIQGRIESNLGFPVYQSFINLPTSSSTAFKSIYITTATLQGNGTYWTDAGQAGLGAADFTQIASSPNVQSCGRNISASFEWSDPASSVDTTTVVGAIKIIGFNAKGEFITETVVMSTMPANSLNAFVRISTLNVSMSVSGVVDTQKKIWVFIGTSNKIGLLGDINSSSDVYKCGFEGGDINRNKLSVSTVYDTIDTSVSPLKVPDGVRDYEFYFMRNKR